MNSFALPSRSIASLEQMRLAGDGARRLLQIVARNIGELLQLGVRTGKPSVLREHCFRPFSLGHVTNDSCKPADVLVAIAVALQDSAGPEFASPFSGMPALVGSGAVAEDGAHFV